MDSAALLSLQTQTIGKVPRSTVGGHCGPKDARAAGAWRRAVSPVYTLRTIILAIPVSTSITARRCR